MCSEWKNIKTLAPAIDDAGDDDNDDFSKALCPQGFILRGFDIMMMMVMKMMKIMRGRCKIKKKK